VRCSKLTCFLGSFGETRRGHTWLGKKHGVWVPTPLDTKLRKLNATLTLSFLGRDLTSPTLENVIVNIVPLQKTHRSGSLQLGLASLIHRSLRLPPFVLWSMITMLMPSGVPIIL